MCSLPQAPSALVVSPKRFVKYETKTFWDVKPGKKVLSSGAHVSAEPAVGAHAYAEPAVGAHVYAEPAVEAMCTQNHAPKKKKNSSSEMYKGRCFDDSCLEERTFFYVFHLRAALRPG